MAKKPTQLASALEHAGMGREDFTSPPRVSDVEAAALSRARQQANEAAEDRSPIMLLLDRSMTSIDVPYRAGMMRRLARVLEWPVISALIWELRTARNPQAAAEAGASESENVPEEGDIGGLFGSAEYDGTQAEARLQRIADPTEFVECVKYLRAGASYLASAAQKAAVRSGTPLVQAQEFWPMPKPIHTQARLVATYRSASQKAADAAEAQVREADQAAQTPAERAALARQEMRNESAAKRFGGTAKKYAVETTPALNEKHIQEEVEYVEGAFAEIAVRECTDYFPPCLWAECPPNVRYQLLRDMFKAVADNKNSLGKRRLITTDGRAEVQFGELSQLSADIAELMEALVDDADVQLLLALEEERDARS